MTFFCCFAMLAPLFLGTSTFIVRPYGIRPCCCCVGTVAFGAGTIIVVPLCFGVAPWLHLLVVVAQVLWVLSLVFLVIVVAEPLCCC